MAPPRSKPGVRVAEKKVGLAGGPLSSQTCGPSSRQSQDCGRFPVPLPSFELCRERHRTGDRRTRPGPSSGRREAPADSNRGREIGRGGGTRTHGPPLPKRVRYHCATPRRNINCNGRPHRINQNDHIPVLSQEKTGARLEEFPRLRDVWVTKLKVPISPLPTPTGRLPVSRNPGLCPRCMPHLSLVTARRSLNHGHN